MNSTKFIYDLNVSDASFDLIKLGKFSSRGEYDGNYLNVQYANSESRDGTISSSGAIPFDLNLGSSNFGKLHENQKIDSMLTQIWRHCPSIAHIADLDSAIGKFEIQLNLSGIKDNFQRNGSIKVEDAILHTLLLSDPITQINGDALMIDNVLSINNLKALLHRNESRSSTPLKQNTEIVIGMKHPQLLHADHSQD